MVRYVIFKKLCEIETEFHDIELLTHAIVHEKRIVFFSECNFMLTISVIQSPHSIWMVRRNDIHQQKLNECNICQSVENQTIRWFSCILLSRINLMNGIWREKIHELSNDSDSTTMLPINLEEFHLLIFPMTYFKCGVKWQIEKWTHGKMPLSRSTDVFHACYVNA